MPAIGHSELVRLCESKGTAETTAHLVDALDKKHLKPDDFSIRDLAEAYLGTEYVNSLRPKSGRRQVMQFVEAVRYSDFSNITGQIVFSKINEGYGDAEFVFTKEVPVVQSDIMDMEKIPGMSRIGDEASAVLEGNAFPYVGFSEDYQHVAAKRKFGMIVAITKEMIFGDRTGLVLKRARDLGYGEGLRLEKRVINALIDENGGAISAALGGHRYFWRDTSYASYQSTTPWINITASNALVDWTDVEAALLKFANMTDPYTGEPISFAPKDIVVTPQNLMTALRIVNATETRTHAGGYPVTGNPGEFASSNPLSGMGFRVLSSPLVRAQAATDSDWWLMDTKRIANRFVNWDMITEEAAANDPASFERDITMQVKVSVKDVVSVVEPRAAHESQA